MDELTILVKTENRNFDIKLAKERDDLLTLEHYTERYLPVQIENMIIENMKVIHDEDMVKRLVGEENKLYNRLQRHIMEMTNYGDGTIFERIKSINEEMSNKLEMKIDLRKQALMAMGYETKRSTKDTISALQDKLDNYIVKFMNLNNENSKILGE